MKRFQVILALAAVMLIAGVYTVIPPVTFSNSHTITIPDGNYFYHIDLNIVKSGHISGTFSDSSGNGIIVYVMNDDQLQSFRTGQSSGSLSSATGTNGAFSANFVAPGTYHIVLQHDTSTVQQTVQVSYQVDGMNVVVLTAGSMLLVLGVALAVIGRRSRKRWEPPRQHSDVIMFDKQPDNSPKSPPP